MKTNAWKYIFLKEHSGRICRAIIYWITSNVLEDIHKLVLSFPLWLLLKISRIRFTIKWYFSTDTMLFVLLKSILQIILPYISSNYFIDLRGKLDKFMPVPCCYEKTNAERKEQEQMVITTEWTINVQLVLPWKTCLHKT